MFSLFLGGIVQSFPGTILRRNLALIAMPGTCK